MAKRKETNEIVRYLKLASDELTYAVIISAIAADETSISPILWVANAELGTAELYSGYAELETREARRCSVGDPRWLSSGAALVFEVEANEAALISLSSFSSSSARL